MSLFPFLRVIVLVLAASPLVYYLLSLYCVIEYFVAMRKLSPRDDSFAPPVSILKAVRGVDHDAYENFASYCRLDYPEYELVFVMADSDVRVERDYLREVVAPFADARVGGVTSFYRCKGGGTLAADLDMLGMCMESVPSALVARRLEGKV